VYVIDLGNFDTDSMRIRSRIFNRYHTLRKDFKLLKTGNTVALTDSNWVRLYDMSDVTKPVKRDSAQLLGTIQDMHIRRDSIIIATPFGAGIEKDFFIFKNTGGILSQLAGLKWLGGGTITFTTNYYINSSNLNIRAWKHPLTERTSDFSKNIPTSLGMVVKGNYIFSVNDAEITIYDITDIVNFHAIDTLDGAGEYIRIYKNLLITAGKEIGGEVFDISDMNNIKKCARIALGNDGFCMDSTSNYYYGKFSSGWLDVVDMTKYIKETKTLTLTKPTANETISGGSAYQIQWSSEGTIPKVNIYYSADNGSNWSSVALSAPNAGAYSWTVPNVSSTTCKVKIEDTSNTAINSISGTFKIVATAIQALEHKKSFPFGIKIITNRIVLTGDISKVKGIDIYNSQGRLVAGAMRSLGDTFVLNGAVCFNGCYVFRVQTEERNYSGRVIYTR
jgi:hypothetical protein